MANTCLSLKFAVNRSPKSKIFVQFVFFSVEGGNDVESSKWLQSCNVSKQRSRNYFQKRGRTHISRHHCFFLAMSLVIESGLDPFSLLIRGRKPFINHDFACRPLSKPSDETFMSSAKGGGKKLQCLFYFFLPLHRFDIS